MENLATIFHIYLKSYFLPYTVKWCSGTHADYNRMARTFNLYKTLIFGGIFLWQEDWLCTVDSTCQMHTGEKTIYIPDVIVVDQHNLVVLTKYLMFGISHSVITSESIMLVH